MNKTKFVTITQKDDASYSDWILPRMARHKMACCDCGLVHDMEFRIVRAGKPKKNGFRKIEKLVKSGLSVQFRARRNIRSTAAKRRNKKHKYDD